MPFADLEPWLRLTLVSGLSNSDLRRILSEFGSPDGVLGASAAALRRHLSAEIAIAIHEGGERDGALRALAWLAEHPLHHILTWADGEYPPQLLEVPEPPALLYVKGPCALLSRPALAIVGSRHASAQGLVDAQAWARALSDAGLPIVSGLAPGIEAAAHRGGLEGASGTVAVFATGLDVIYPARHHALAHEIALRGTWVSELPPGSAPLSSNFVRRNRIISGLGRGCLVVEAALQSGALMTARFANEQGREVFAVPGSIHSPVARGCHRLIKQGAKLVDDVNDIFEELGLPPLRLRGGRDTQTSSSARRIALAS